MNEPVKLPFRAIEAMVDCSFCQQPKGQACVTRHKRRLELPHMARIREAYTRLRLAEGRTESAI